MARFIRIRGLTVFVPRKDGSVDVIFPDTEAFPKTLGLPRHEPVYRSSDGDPANEVGLIGEVVYIDAGEGKAVTLSGAGSTPTDPADTTTQDSFQWLPFMPSLAGAVHLDPSHLPSVDPADPLPPSLRGALRIRNGGTLWNGGFAADPPKSFMLEFSSNGRPGIFLLAEAALLEIPSTSTITARKSTGGSSAITILLTSTTKEAPDLFINETTGKGDFTTDFRIFEAMLAGTPASGPSLAEEKTLRPWPSGFPDRLKGGRSAGRPVCPPVVIPEGP